MDIIIHAGGSIDNYHYTNTLESIQKNINYMVKHQQTILCELDCSILKDSYIIAHDGLEKKYNLTSTFNNYTFNECLNLKYLNKYTPLFFKDLYLFINNFNNVNIYFIIDSKHDLDENFINHIITNMKEHKDKIILQVYNNDDIIVAEKYNFKCLYALWKYNSSTYNESIKINLDYIKEKHINCIGISLFYQRIAYKDQLELLLSHNIKIYIHGESNHDKCLEYINNSFGIFSHNPEKYL